MAAASSNQALVLLQLLAGLAGMNGRAALEGGNCGFENRKAVLNFEKALELTRFNFFQRHPSVEAFSSDTM
jgi:hypothetical protein